MSGAVQVVTAALREDQSMEKRLAWYCGQMKAEPKLIGNRVVDYRYVPVNGCGEMNRPGTTECWNCGKQKPVKPEGKAA